MESADGELEESGAQPGSSGSGADLAGMVHTCISRGFGMQQNPFGNLGICGYGEKLPCTYQGPDFRLVRKPRSEPAGKNPERAYVCKAEPNIEYRLPEAEVF